MPDGFLSAPAVVNALLLLASLYIYLSLVRQIWHRHPGLGHTPSVKPFGWPDALVGFGLATLFIVNAFFGSEAEGKVVLQTNDLIFNLLISGVLLFLITAFLTFRGIDVSNVAGFSKLSIWRTVVTGAILLIAAYPLVLLADLATQHFLGGMPSRQGIVEFFSGSQTLQQRVFIIVLAVAIAPIVEEFVFRFYIYGIAKRYLGLFGGLLVNALLFSAVHAHLPSAAPLFVLGACFTLAYEWSGSILVSMTMHALFNSLTLISLAFPNSFPQQ